MLNPVLGRNHPPPDGLTGLVAPLLAAGLLYLMLEGGAHLLVRSSSRLDRQQAAAHVASNGIPTREVKHVDHQFA